MTILVLQSIFEARFFSLVLECSSELPVYIRGYIPFILRRKYFEGDILVWRINGGFHSVWHGAGLVANRAADLKIRSLKWETHMC